MAANRGQEFVFGYVPNGNLLDSILVGYYDGRDLMYASRIRPGLQPSFGVPCCRISRSFR